MELGPTTLSNTELLALILRHGTRDRNVLDIACSILGEHDLKEFASMQVPDFRALHGIGKAKACTLAACFELARRLAATPKEEKIVISNAKDAASILLPHLSMLKQEQVRCLYLNSRKRLITQKTIFIGSLHASIIHPRDIFEPALRNGAAAIIVFHNHPSGDPAPSDEDIEITGQLQQAGEILGIELLDHIIIGDQSYCSLKENGFMN